MPGTSNRIEIHFAVFNQLYPEAAELGGGALGASALFSWNRSAVLAKLKCPFWSVAPHFRGASVA